MKKTALFLFGFFQVQLLIAQVITPATKPNKTQQLLIKRGYGMFMQLKK